jgi:hypothetical protein
LPLSRRIRVSRSGEQMGIGLVEREEAAERGRSFPSGRTGAACAGRAPTAVMEQKLGGIKGAAGYRFSRLLDEMDEIFRVNEILLIDFQPLVQKLQHQRLFLGEFVTAIVQLEQRYRAHR